MANYLLIESRDPFETNDVGYFYDLAKGLIKEGHQVTLFLVQNGVLPARKSAQSNKISELAKNGVKVVADDFSLQERGIITETLTPEVKPASIDLVVDLLADKNMKAVWH
jgi:sulfur relay (sulfurtransferase) complex TusBCD TusD component (DsrE family)